MHCLRRKSKIDNQQYAKEQINRYVYQVSRFLFGKNKEDIEKEIFKLIEGRYTLRLMIVTIFCNAINLALVIYIFRHFPIWNNNFPGQFLAAAQITGLPELQDSWSFITQTVFLGIVAFGTVVDTLSCIVKTLVYGLGRQEE